MSRCRLPLCKSGEGADDLLPACRASLPVGAPTGTARGLSRTAQTLEELDMINRPALVLIAARVGATRLIDNTLLVPRGVPVPEHLRDLIEDAPSRSS